MDKEHVIAILARLAVSSHRSGRHGEHAIHQLTIERLAREGIRP